MAEWQVSESLTKAPSPLQITTIHPTYDVVHRVWLAEVEDRTFAAPTLRQLQAKLPTAVIQDYYPNGYQAEREGFLQPYQKVRWYPTHLPATTQRFQIAALKKAEARRKEVTKADRQEYKQQRQQAIVAKVKPKNLDHDVVMNMYNDGYESLQIALELKCSVGTVQLHRLKALKRGDPRAKSLVIKHKNRRVYLPWTDEIDEELKWLVEGKCSAKTIAQQLGRTRNAIIGRCRRKGYMLSGTNNKPRK